MGGKFSKQEEMFLERRWSELLEDAMTTDAELMSSPSSSQDKRHSGFRMSFKEWQALITLLSADAPGDILSHLCEEIRSVHLTNRPIVLTIYACCWFDGYIDDTSFANRLCGVRESMESHQDPVNLCASSYIANVKEDDTGEVELFDIASDVFASLLLHSVSGGLDSPSSPSSPSSSTLFLSKAHRGAKSVDALMAWSPARPVALLAHAFLCAVVAARHASPFYAASAIRALRGLPPGPGSRPGPGPGPGPGSGSGEERGPGPGPGARDVTGWPVVGRLERALLRRQCEADVADLCAGRGGRWWQPAPAEVRLAGTPLAGMGQEERWEAVEAAYVGQRHVWEALRTHFVASDVFDVEKPTVIVLFGPSGFGKSEMAKRVAAAVHGVELSDVEASGKLVHIHLPSFCTKDSIYSLVDPPAAHVGEGVLLSALRRCEDAVVVLDEFEKGTADAIQNLWLSAFQKNGTLRSLKDASRSVSTIKTTFVLTCNIAAQTILKGTEQYLKGTLNEQAAMRAEWEAQCKDHCRETMHDPFVNRVDYFLPFVPYTKEEVRRFIEIQLRRVLADQLTKGRRVYVTPRMVDELVTRLHTFHASTIEGIVRPLLVEMVTNKYSAAVFTVEERVAGTVFVALPVRSEQSEWMSIEGAERALDTWDEVVKSEFKNEEPIQPALPSSLSVTENSQEVKLPTTSLSSALTPAPGSTWKKEKILQLDTTKEKDIRVELQQAKELLLEKDKEIMYLKEKVLQLEKLVALLLSTTLLCLYTLSFIVGTTTALVMGAALLFGMCLVVHMPLELLFGAIKVLYSVLGPFGTAFAVVAVSFWFYIAPRYISHC